MHQAPRRAVRTRLHALRRWPEQGASVVEWVLLTPVLLLLIFTIIQFALVWHAEQVAQAAASQALSAARIQGGTQAAGQREAQRILDQLAGGTLPTRQITVTRTVTTATVRVTGTAQSILPFFTLHIHAEAAGPTERLVP
jgi:Flp pilus assembly protein TadG